MPGLTSLPLNLSEILEARRGPLRELEIWALLCQCAEALQDLILKGDALGENVFRLMITPNTLLLRDNGTILLAENAQSPHGSLYMAPEYDPRSQHLISDAVFEKMFVYSLGRTLQVASEFGLQENEILGISYDLDSLLQAMSEKNATARLSLMQILEACSLQASQHPDKLPHSLVLSRLYKSVLTGYQKQSSFNDSNYGSEHSHEAVMSHKPGRVRKPRPQVRHRHLRRRRRQGSTSSASSRESRSRSRSRSRSPDRPTGSQTVYRAGESCGAESHLSPDARLTPAYGMMNAASSSQLLNISMTSNSSELSTLERRRQIPQYSAASSVQGLLGLRQGSPAYQKYIKLKERQMRLRQAKSGQPSGALNDIRSRVMTPPLMSVEMMDNMSESHSMASLMSYTLGSYRPYLHADLGSEAGLHFASDPGTSSASQVSLLFAGMDYGQPMRAQAVPINVKQVIPEQLVHQATMTDAITQAEQEPIHAQQAPVVTHEMLHPQAKEKSAKSPGMPAEMVSSQAIIRDFEGPEFVHNMQKPAVSVMVPFQGDAEKKRLVTVAHLTGQSYNVVVNPSFTGRQLFDMVIPFLDLDDFYFFGLAYIFEGEQRFLDADTKLHKVAPVGWKEGPKGHQSHITFILNVRVKFYPEALTDFRHLSSRHMLYLQLRRDIVGERFMTEPDLLYKLAGLALQAEYGDYTKERAGATGSLERSDSVPQPYYTAEYYVPGSLLKQAGATMVYTKVTRRHKASAGLNTFQAELEFITCVQNLPEYGIHFYKLMKTKTGSESPVWLGLSRQNLSVAEPSVSGIRTITQRHQWENIHNIDFSKRRFSFRPKVEGAKGKAPKISFYTNSFRKGRYMLQFLKEQHQFKIPVKSRPPSEYGRTTEQIAPQLESGIEENTIREEAPVSQAAVNPLQQSLPDSDDNNDDLEEDWSVPTRRPVVPPVRYRSPPPYQAPAMAQILGGDGVFPGTEVSPLHASLTDLHGSEFDRDQLRALLDMSSTDQGLECASASNKNADGVAAPPYLPPDSDFLAAGRRIFEVTLAKEEGHGVGITIVGGETTSSLDLGIFIKSVVPGGPAERDGRISCGDRLIAIGGTSLEGKQHHEAVAMIRDSGPTVTFLVSQVRPPGTVKKRRSPVQDANFEKKLRDSMAEYRSGNLFASRGKDSFDDFFTKSLQDEQVNDTFLNFDDFVNNEHKHISISGSDVECNSDEENYPLEPLFPDPYPVRPVQLETSTQDITSIDPSLGHQQKAHSYNVEEAQAKYNQGSSHPISSSPYGTASKIESHLVPDEATLLKLSSPPIADEHDAETFDTGGIQVIDLQGDEELAKELMKESQDWQREDDIPNLMSYPNAHLTLEEQEDLHILGDLAALEADGSSSDSDFDSAIQKTIEGPCSKINPSCKSVNSSAALVFTAPENDKSSDHVSPTDVIYEVILEKDFGIVVEVAPQPNLPGSIEGCVVIKEILDDSPAQRGGILAIGDQILEVGGQSVAGQDSQGVQELLDSAPYLTTMKIVRSKVKDMSINRKGLDSEWKLNNGEVGEDVKDHVHPQHDTNLESPLTALIPKAPTESTPPLGEELQIVPPPPPLVGLDATSDSNTQSDVDSDVLDSSRSEVSHRHTDTIGVHHPMAASKGRLGKTSDHANNFWMEDAENRDDVSTTTDTLKLEDSSEFDAKLDELKAELDRQLEREIDSPNLPSQSSGSSSADSVARSPRKLVASLEGRKDDDEEEEEHDDDDDVVVTMYGDQHVGESPAAAKTVKDKGKSLEEDVMDPYEPLLLSVSLGRQKTGFGFTVAGGVNTGGCYVKQLVAEPAISDGRLRPGDKILQVNGQDTTSMGHVETVTLLRKVTDVAHLKLLRFPSTMETQQRIEAAQAQAELASALNQANLKKSKTPDSLETQPERQQTLTAPKVVIQEHDDEKDPVRDYPNVDFGKKAESEQAGVFRVELSRPATSWAMLGIVLAEREADQGVDSQALVYVKRIKDGGLASRAGGLQKGDIILQVNGVSFIGMPAHEAVKCLREAGQKIVLTISRPERDEAEDEDDGEASDHEGHDTDDNGDGMTIIVEQVETPSQGRPPSRVSDQYDSSRKAKTDVPVILSDAWLNDLPLMRMAVEQHEEGTREILQALADLVESGEPSDTFKRLRQLPATAPCSEGQLQENKYKNRYRNVLPYDFNRVKLTRKDDRVHYINASYVDMPLTDYTGDVTSVEYTENAVGDDGDRPREDNSRDQTTGEVYNDSDQQCLKYIACQGPLESTVSDLWLLVWQEKVHVIAMLTQTHESGKMKCFPYWPTDKEETLSVDDGALVVKQVRNYSLSDIDVVQVVIEEPSTDEWQEVVILQHKGWPDHGAPDTALPLLKLLQVMHLLENGSPPVIHCSAGVGRTGALIAIDVALACIEHGYKFNLSDIVSKLRSQRQGMVQTTDQYLFCYTACMEALLSMES